MEKFDPNQVTFAEGEVRVERVLRSLKVDKRAIMTSQDPIAEKLKKALPVANVPKGFVKWQLPFVFPRGQFFFTQATAGAEVAEHAHEEGDGVRFIVGGSIVYEGKELKSGDWMYIPQGARYKFKVGANGASMCYCYCCCCAGRADIKSWLGDPSPVAHG